MLLSDDGGSEGKPAEVVDADHGVIRVQRGRPAVQLLAEPVAELSSGPPERDVLRFAQRRVHPGHASSGPEAAREARAALSQLHAGY